MLKRRRNEIQLLLMILISVSSQLFALYKSSYTATHFGATNEMDAYNYATNIANFLFSFITTGVTTVIIPAYVKRKNPRAVNTFITIVYTVVFTLMALIYLLRTPIINFMTNRDEIFTNFFADFLVYAFVIQAIVSFLAVTTAYYQCTNHYVIPKFIVLVSNLIVFFVLIITKNLTIEEYILALVLGSIVNFIVDVLIAVRMGFRYSPSWDFLLPETKELMIIFLPTLFSSGIYKVQTMVDSMIAANLGTGQLTILTYSSQIANMVNTFVVGNLTVYAYPKIVSRILEKDGKKKLWNYALLFHAIVCLIICGFINVGDYCINLVFVGGNFGLQSGILLYVCSCIYILGQQTNIIRDLIYRYFYANDDTKTTFYNSVTSSILNIVISIILVVPFGIYGIIIGTILAGAISLITILIRFNKKFTLDLEFKLAFREYLKTVICSAITIFTISLLKRCFPTLNIFISIVLWGILTIVIFIFLLCLSKSKVLRVRI